MRIRDFLVVPVLAAIAFCSCGTPKNMPYFQDLEPGVGDTISVSQTIRLMPGDKISVIVNCRDAMLASMFNLSYATRYVGQTNPEQMSASQSTGVQGYLVDEEGCIDIPVLGSVKVEGLTRNEVAAMVKRSLVEKELLKDAVVTVEYLNLRVSVLGEVLRPGRVNIDKDTFTILDALSAAGDLTIFGRRENVRIMRTEDGVCKTYVVNLCSGKELMSSEVYYLQQNDIIYVEPNDVRARQSTVNGNNIRSASFWLSIASLLTTISYYFILR